MELRIETKEFFDSKIDTISIFAGTWNLTRKEKDDETEVTFAKEYIIYVGTMTGWEEKDDDLLFQFKNQRHTLTLSSKKYQGGRIYASLYDAARFMPIPDYAWEQLYRQIKPYCVPLWDARLYSNVLRAQYAISKIKLDLAGESAYATHDDPPVELTLI